MATKILGWTNWGGVIELAKSLIDGQEGLMRSI